MVPPMLLLRVLVLPLVHHVVVTQVRVVRVVHLHVLTPQSVVRAEVEVLLRKGLRLMLLAQQVVEADQVSSVLLLLLALGATGLGELCEIVIV